MTASVPTAEPASTVTEARAGRGSHAAAALADGLLQRAASSLLILVLAAVSSPTLVGAAATLAVALTLYQALFEAPLRQSAQRALAASPDAEAFVRRRALAGGVFGTALMTAAIVFLLVRSPAAGSLTALWPAVVVPLVSQTYVVALIRLQQAGGWTAIATGRLVASLASLGLGLAALAADHYALAISVQMVVAEAAYAAWVLSRGRRRPGDGAPVAPVSASEGAWDLDDYRQDLRHTTAFSVFGWSRGQGDRLALTAFAAQSVLGVFSLGYAFARAAGDAALHGSMNLLRTRLAVDPAQDRASRAGIMRRHLLMTAGFSAAAAAGGSVAAWVATRWFLGPEWAVMARAVPLLGLSLMCAGFNWAIGALLNHVRRSRSAYPVQLLEAVGCLPVGWVLAHDLVLGSGLVLLREGLACALLWLPVRRYVPGWLNALWAAPVLLGLVLLIGLR